MDADFLLVKNLIPKKAFAPQARELNIPYNISAFHK